MLIACGGSSAATTATPDRLQTETTAAATATTAAASGEDRDSFGIPPAIDRKVIYEGSMTLQAADTRTAFDEILFKVETSGGFLASSTIEEAAEGEQPSIVFTVRVAADNLSATLAEIREVADRVVSESLQSQDVTDQFVDIDAQLRNLYVLETELLALLAELRDNPDADPAKLLAVFEQIRYTRGEIEQLEGRKQLLSDLVALATINLTVVPSPAAIPIVPADPVWEPATVAKEALRNLVEAMQGLGTVAIRFVLYTLPVLVLVIGPFAILGWWLWRRTRRATPVPATVEAAES